MLTREELLALHRDFDSVVDRIEDLTLKGEFPMGAGARLLTVYNRGFIPWFRMQRELLPPDKPDQPETWPQ